MIQPTAEQKLMDELAVEPLSDWRQGKVFRSISAKSYLAFDPGSVGRLNDSLDWNNLQIFYLGINRKSDASGEIAASILFDTKAGRLEYIPNNILGSRIEDFKSTALPMFVDIDLVKTVNEALVGKRIYTRTNVWYGNDGEKIVGEKYHPVVIDSVTAGGDGFPFKVFFHKGDLDKRANAFDVLGKSEEYASYYLLMNANSSGASRTFANLFSLENPRRRFPNTSDEIWENIMNGKVIVGMTKDECRLSLGSADDTESGQDRLKTIEIWKYSDGRMLRFEDGILEYFRM